MRNKMVFSRLPGDSVLPGGSIISNSKAKAKMVLEHSTQDLRRLQHVARQIRPEALADAFKIVAGCDVSSLRDFVRQRKPIPPIRTLYFYHVPQRVNDEIMAQLWRDHELLAAGPTVELFIYAMTYHPGGAREMMSQLYTGAAYVPLPKSLRSDVVQALLTYRQCRSHARGLDKLTKLAQLPSIEHDHVVLKFLEASYSYAGEDNVLMLGSGALGGTHMVIEQPVVLVDPLIPYSGQGFDTYVKKRWDEIKVDAYDPILSDVAAGTSVGMSKGTTYKGPPDKLDIACMTKLDLQDEDGPNGYLVRKPRPHNSEVIWQIDREADTWASQVGALRSEVIDANEKRMHNFLCLNGTTNIMPHASGPERVSYVKRRPCVLPKIPSVTSRKMPAPSPLTLAQDRRLARAKKFSERLAKIGHQDLEHICAKAVNWCLLPPDALADGSLERLDPCLGSIDFSVHSLIVSAREHGYFLYKTAADTWMMKKERLYY